MDEQNPIPSQYLTSLAILAAGIIIAFSIYYTRTNSSPENSPLLKNDIEEPNLETGTPKGIQNGGTAILAVKNDDFVLGNPNAAKTVIEYGDFQCPFCERFYQTTEKELKEKYVKTGKAKFIWRDFAFLGEESLWASEAARCASEQGKFWQYHDYLFENQKGENQGAFSKENLKKFAKNLGFNASSFNQCLDSEKYKTKVENNTKEGRSLGVDGTPTTFINGEMVVGAQPFSVFEEMLR